MSSGDILVERVARLIDPVAWADSWPDPTDAMDVPLSERRRTRSLLAARRVVNGLDEMLIFINV